MPAGSVPAGRGCGGSRAGSRGPSRRRSAPRRRRAGRSGRTRPGSCSSRNRGLVSRSGETSRTSTSSAASRAATSSHSVAVGAGDLDRPDAGAGGRGDLVAHQREQRADQQGRAAAAAAQQRRRHEVDRRLAPAGALHDERPLRPLDQRRDGGVLPLAELRVGAAGELAQDLQRLGSRDSVGGAAVLMGTTVGSGTDSRRRRAELGTAEENPQAMRAADEQAPGQPRAHPLVVGHRRVVHHAQGLRAGDRAGAAGDRVHRAPGLHRLAEDDRAHTEGLLGRHPRAAAADRRRGLLRRARRGAATASPSCGSVRRRGRRAAPVRRQRRRAPARLPRSTASSARCTPST